MVVSASTFISVRSAPACVPSVDLLLEPYAERSYKMLTEKYTRLGLDADTVEKEVMADILNDFEQGFQGWEYKFNTVASSRGDYPFITMTMGTGTGRFAKLASITSKLIVDGSFGACCTRPRGADERWKRG